MPDCTVCGAPFGERKGKGRPAQCCSDACRRARALRQMREWRAANRDHVRAYRKAEYMRYKQRLGII